MVVRNSSTNLFPPTTIQTTQTPNSLLPLFSSTSTLTDPQLHNLMVPFHTICHTPKKMNRLRSWKGSTHSHTAVPLAWPCTSSSSLPVEKYSTSNTICLTNCQENIIDIHSCLCRGLHEQKAIFVSITLSFVMFHHPFICQICFIARKCNNNIWWCLPLKFFYPCLCSPKCILKRQLQFN